ncbi:Major Facilitator Superfamily (MFS) [Thraustotheca clavata]|uniref:Major Facilitator Superfamily (MFS) n=1 Tax=Thraustotheca clavata TaxID=74557 RepID=A0A1W0A5M6_9STRA|nr:Major Facilitator Superfamily (MFS) [Thraustotheca clavata]
MQLPTKTPSEIEAEEWLFFLPLAQDNFLTFRWARFHRIYLFLAVVITQFCAGTMYSMMSLSKRLGVCFNAPHEVNYGLFVGCAFMAFVAALSGPAIERHGPRWSMCVGIVLLTFGMVISQIAVAVTSLIILYLGCIISSIGFGYLMIISVATCQKWCPDLRGTVTGVAIAGFGLGGGSWNYFYDFYLKLHEARLNSLFLVCIGIMLPPLILSAMIMRTPPPTFRAKGLDMHGIASAKAPPPRYVQDEYLHVGMTLVNYNLIEEGTERQYYEQVKALSLLQCIASTDFFCLYLAFAATAAPSLAAYALFNSSNGNYNAIEWFNMTKSEVKYVSDCGFLTSSLSRLFVPILSDILVRVFYANPAFARKLILVVLLLIATITFLIFSNDLNDGYPSLLHLTIAIKLVSGGGASLIVCILADMYGVYNVGTMYGLILTSWSFGLVIVGLTIPSTAEAFVSEVHALFFIALTGLILMVFVRTNSRDRFYQGYRLTIWGKVVIDIPFIRSEVKMEQVVLDDEPPTWISNRSSGFWFFQYWHLRIPSKTPIELAGELSLIAFPSPFGRDGEFAVVPWPRFSRWYLLFTSFLTQCCCGSIFGYPALSNALDVLFLGNITSHHAVLLNIFIAMSTTIGATVFLVGPAIERRAPRISYCFGCIFVIVGQLIAHIAVLTRYQALLIAGHGVISAIGYGILLLSSISTVQKWFPDYRGISTTSCMLGIGVGVMIWTAIYNYFAFIPSILSPKPQLHNIFLFSFGVIIPVFLFGLIVIRSPPPSFLVNDMDMHAIAVDPMLPSTASIHNEFVSTGRTLVNYNFIRSGSALGVQLRALTLAQCILSLDFLLLYIAFIASSLPGIVVTSRLNDLSMRIYYEKNFKNTIAQNASIATLLGLLFAPCMSDFICRIFEIRAAPVRLTSFTIGLLAQCILSFLVASALQDQNLYGFEWSLLLMAFACGCNLGIVPCFLADMYGVYNMGSMYGIILTGYSVNVLVAAGLLNQSHLEDPNQLATSLYGMIYLLIISWILTWFIRTSTQDQFFPGYQITIWGRIIIQVHSHSANNIHYEEETSYFQLDTSFIQLPPPPPPRRLLN